MSKKIFITGASNIDKMSLAKELVKIDDDLSIGAHFSNDLKYKDIVDDNYIYYLSTQDIDLTYKNNFVLFVNTNNYISSGITLDTFYNNDVFIMSMCEFNNISDNILKNPAYDIIVIWIDDDYKRNLDEDIRESKFLQERLNDNIKYMYFYNEENKFIVNTIFTYLNGNDEERKQLLLENN